MRKATLVVYNRTDFGGAERRLIRIYNELAKDHEVELIIRGCRKKDFLPRLERSDCKINNIKKIKCFKSSISCLLYMIFIRDVCNIHYFDLCGFNLRIGQILKIRKIPTLLTIAHQNYAYGLIDENIKKRLAQLMDVSSKVDVLFPAGEEFLPTISSNKNISITPGTFTQLDVFIPKKKEKILLFAAARLESDKNAKLLIEACNLCHDDLKRNKYKVVISGKGYEENKLRDMVKELKLGDIIDMPGYVKISDITPRAEMFLCLDLIDNYPSQTIAEAVASGCALVCTDVGYSSRCGSPEFTYLVKNDKNALASVIVDFIQKEENQKDEIFKSAREYAEKYYSIECSKNYFEKLIDWGEKS